MYGMRKKERDRERERRRRERTLELPRFDLSVRDMKKFEKKTER